MAIIVDVSSIAVLAADNAWSNYRDALWRAKTTACPNTRRLLNAVARASLDQYFRRVEQDPRMLPYHMSQAGYWLDRRMAGP